MAGFKSQAQVFDNVWDKINKKRKKEVFAFNERYKAFIDKGKTEREVAREMVKIAKENGYQDINQLVAKGEPIKAGQKVYALNKDKSLVMFVIGKKPLAEGMHIVGGHIDSPRIDIKPMPLYEDSGVGLFKTHYYGGIKKYQWTTLPLSLHGRVVKTGGETIDFSIGEKDSEPVFHITDLLPHLAKDQMKKTLAEGITGEGLNIVVGSIPVQSKDAKERVKEALLKLLKDEYNIEEKDFVSAEIEAVPAGKARDVGFDRSFVSAYGQDDRVCSYAGFEALLTIDEPEYTAVGMFMDKEEIGSMGNTGSESVYFENCVAELINLQTNYSDLLVRRAFANTKVLSADVTAAHDPNFASATDKQNSAYVNKGVCLMKYTGSRGKGGCSDANAEFVGFVKDIFDKAGVVWQTGELGKVDQGGGGTIAYILANKGAEVVDCGVPVFSMHAPYELASKADIYMTYLAYKAFFDYK